MSSPGGMSTSLNNRPAQQTSVPPGNSSNDGLEDGVSIRPMRLKVLYTFDDQNKTNCLARGQDVLQIKTVALDETTSIGIIELKTCIEAVVQCSPEIVTRLGQADYTVYAYDYSEYDNPLVGQGMLSKALASASPTPDAPAHQSQKLITGRVCKNILGLFNNGVKETLEVKLRLIPVPTVMQGEYVSSMEKYRELSSSIPPGFDHNEWTKFLQSNPNMSQMASKFGAPASTTSNQRGSMNMEVVNQLLSPSIQQQQEASQDPFNQASNVDSGNESTTKTGKAKKTSRPAAAKRPRAKRQPKATATGGNTSGYEEGTDGDDGPAPRKRAKITKTDWKSKSSFGPATDSLRVAASTAGSLRLFRPIAMSPAPVGGSHLQDVPRAPTPVPNLPNQHLHRDREPSQSSLRRESPLAEQPHISPYPSLQPPGGLEDELRVSIESANASPEKAYSPAETPEMNSSPPVMRTASPAMRSSPPCPSSPILPQMPRTDSGFMSGSMEELFGQEEDDTIRLDDDLRIISEYSRGPAPSQPADHEVFQGFVIEEEAPGPMELLPKKMPVYEPTRPKSRGRPRAVPRSRTGSVMSEDGQQCLPPLKSGNVPASRRPTPMRRDSEIQISRLETTSQVFEAPQVVVQNPTPLETNSEAPAQLDAHQPPAPPQSRPGSRMLVRTASVGSLTLPAPPASDPVLPPSYLQRSQTWSEAPHPATEAPTQMYMPAPILTRSEFPAAIDPGLEEGNRSFNLKKAAIKQRLEDAIAKGEMPQFCSNCGAVETPTWRKAWSQDYQGAPPYYEYSDEPGRVTTIVILARDAIGQPMSYQIVKKYLAPEEDAKDFQEFNLCNPCGIWLSKYKAHRPEERWECNRKKPADKKGKKPQQRRPESKKKQSAANLNPTSEANYPQSEANFPQSEAWFPQSEANFPQSEAPWPAEGVSPGDTTGVMPQLNIQVQRVELPDNLPQVNKPRPAKRLNAMTSDAASAALRRAIKSSPTRWAGTQTSPVEVDDALGSTRRLLFPSPRKDGSPKVLGELQSNVVQIGDNHSPKEQTTDIPDKENCPPALDSQDIDPEILKLFEDEMARPTTPVQKSPVANPFKTPTRPTPSHRPITRSVTRSNRSIKSASQLLTFTPSKTPGSVRRSPRHHHAVFESPFTATINQMMSEANNQTSPSRHCNGMELDFGNLPDLPLLGGTQNDTHFSLEDFFSTDVPMPSSPPKFHLYEDPNAIANVDWSDFNFDTSMLDNGTQRGKEVVVKEEPTDEEPLQDTEKVSKEPGECAVESGNAAEEMIEAADISQESAQEPTKAVEPEQDAECSEEVDLISTPE